jgi:hypothetical protein
MDLASCILFHARVPILLSCCLLMFRYLFINNNNDIETKGKIVNGIKVAFSASTIVMLYFGVLTFLTYFLFFQSFFDLERHHHHIIKTINGIVMFICYLAAPFKFFIGKEFLMVLFDELMNGSMSSKIEQYKK